MLSLAVRGLAFGLVEELVADGAQLWVTRPAARVALLMDFDQAAEVIGSGGNL
jgi:NAD(P)-dependent dehydrogenase (short-subunit alcohol dehydrogenase family)